MDSQEFDRLDQRVRERARRLWEEEGRPNVPEETYLDKARELVAIEDNEPLTHEPIGEYTSDSAGREPVEEIPFAVKTGDVPTLRDQGEEQTTPSPEQHPAKAPLGSPQGEDR